MTQRILDASVQLDIIAPVFNEGENIEPFLASILPVLNTLPCRYQIIFINDGSADDSLLILRSLAEKNQRLSVISFMRNFGKEAAITAGLEYSTADMCIPIDVDLQHPPEAIPLMLAEWEKGNGHVIAVRRKRDTESFLKKISAGLFYKIFNACSEFSIPNNAGDFRLMDRKFLDKLLACRERNRFMKGLYAWVGGDAKLIEYDVRPRMNNVSSFSLFRLFRLAFDALTAFTTIPLRLWSFLGVAVCFFSAIFGCYLIVRHLVSHVTTPGYDSLMVVLLFFGGVQLVSLGIIGEYLARLFMESKARPLYLIDFVINGSD